MVGLLPVGLIHTEKFELKNSLALKKKKKACPEHA